MWSGDNESIFLSSLGVGWAVVLIAFFTDFFYNVIISWALYYLAASFTSKLPWTTCGDWASENCFSVSHEENVRYPTCIHRDRNSTCESYKTYRQELAQCAGMGGNCTTTNFTYPVMSMSEAAMSLPEPLATALFNQTEATTGYLNESSTIAVNSSLMSLYCDWKPTSTSPAAEYFKLVVVCSCQ